MSDIFSKVKRSEVMSRIRGLKNKSTELALIRIFRIYRITGWRRHYAVFGKPDFTFPQQRLAVFVDGCFWHFCRIHAKLPENNRDFWHRKLRANMARDRLVNRTLKKNGWKITRIWEHELAQKTGGSRIQKILALLQQKPD